MIRPTPHAGYRPRARIRGSSQRLDGHLHLVPNVAELLVELFRLRSGDRPLLGRPDEPLLLQDSQVYRT